MDLADVAIGGDLGDERGQGSERLAELETRVAALESMLIGQAAWMSDMQQNVSAGLEEMSGVQQGLESHA